MRKARCQSVFYAGDSPAGGPANYLLAILGTLDISLTHIPPGRNTGPELLKRPYDVFILSDYGRRDLDRRAETLLESQVRRGAGLLMVGGWGSFSGPFGRWRGSRVESLLPVRCAASDDRVNLATGLLVKRKKNHSILRGLSFSRPPVLIGLNRVLPRPGSEVVLSASPLKVRAGKPVCSEKEYPLLVLSGERGLRTAALTTDLAPHWCGGWVDWGARRRALPVTAEFGVEVGDWYVRFVRQLIQWLLSGSPLVSAPKSR